MNEYKGAAVFIDGSRQRYAVSFSDRENGEHVVLTGLAEDAEQHWARTLGERHDVVIQAAMMTESEGAPVRSGGYDRAYPRMMLTNFVVGQDIAQHQEYPVYTATFMRVPK